MTAQPPESVRSVIASWIFMGLILGVIPLFGAFLRTTDLIEVARVGHGPVGTVTITAGSCAYDENYEVACDGRFVPDDPALPAHRVVVLTSDIRPDGSVRAREASAGSVRAWADDYRPAWGHWLVFVVLFGGFGIFMLSYVTVETVRWRRRRRALPSNDDRQPKGR